MKPRTKQQLGSRRGIAPVRPLALNLGVVAESLIASEDDVTKDWYVEGFASTDDVDLTQYAPSSAQPVGLRVMESALQDLVTWSKKLPTVFRNHDLNEEIGMVEESAVKDGKFWVKIKISKTRPDIWTKIQEGVLSKFSVSFIPVEETLVEMAGVSKPVRQIIHAVGLETSVVGLPMNPEADITEAYAAGVLNHIEEFLAARAEPVEEQSMDRKQLVEGIKARLEALKGEKDATKREELQLEAHDFHQRLALIAADAPPLGDGWDFPAVAVEVAAVEPAPVVEAPVVEAAPAVVVEVAPVEVATATADAVIAAIETPAAERTPAEVLGDAISLMFGTIVKRSIPADLFANMAWLEAGLDSSQMSDKVKEKTKGMLVTMLKLVAENVQAEKESLNTGDLGALKRSFESQLAAHAKTTHDSIVKLQRELAEKAEALGKLEKKHAEVLGMTLTPPNAAPPVAPARALTRDEALLAVWDDKPLISVGR